MFLPHFVAIFKLIFRLMECTIDNGSIYKILYYKNWLK